MTFFFMKRFCRFIGPLTEVLHITLLAITSLVYLSLCATYIKERLKPFRTSFSTFFLIIILIVNLFRCSTRSLISSYPFLFFLCFLTFIVFSWMDGVVISRETSLLIYTFSHLLSHFIPSRW